MKLNRRTLFTRAATAAAALVLSACGGGDPLEDGNGESGGGPAPEGTIVVGSQAYYSNEIVAEIYAQALEDDGHTVERRMSIGQRDAYLPALEAGEVHVFPEYTGNLLQYLDEDTTETGTDEVYEALEAALPDGLTVLEQAPATDQDSYTVTSQVARDENLQTIADLAELEQPVSLGGPPELEQRPYGPAGLEETYGVQAEFVATGDTTVQDLVAGTVQVANVYTADPRIETESLTVLEDPEELFLASHIVPIVASDIADEIRETLDAINEKLTTDELIGLNLESTDGRASSEIATEWLEEQGLL